MKRSKSKTCKGYFSLMVRIDNLHTNKNNLSAILLFFWHSKHFYWFKSLHYFVKSKFQ